MSRIAELSRNELDADAQQLYDQNPPAREASPGRHSRSILSFSSPPPRNTRQISEGSRVSNSRGNWFPSATQQQDQSARHVGFDNAQAICEQRNL